MRQSFDVGTAQDAHEATNHLYKHFIKPQALAGVRGRVTWEPVNTSYRHQLRKLFHGAVLDAFAWQVRLPDAETGRLVRFTPEVWKRHLMSLLRPLETSSEDLTDEDYALFIMESEAYGVTECGIQFPDKGGPDAAQNPI